ncbi:GNAT family N-acetyltransferase [Myxococcus sp. K15C18031901]|uniref:GNAT family N-acetyltransferase n=1 Tax=Myxococcus dinghuensis TaxID=2906761 RepID=UPI0020A802DA|nr:GNAT family N-acetyltransferase [Myxococcus dinghuensis]MCP3099078.1 GNAT family N-acetyltransferase [Myxococcus dinghuensis]
MSFSSRPTQDSDEGFLFTLYAANREGELATWGWTPPQREAFLRMQWLAQRRSWAALFPGASDHLVLMEGRPVGRLLVDRGGAVWSLVDVALMPSHQGGGLGTRVLRELLAEAGAARRPLTLHVLQANPARRLYGRLGFLDVAPARPEEPYVAMRWTPATNAG